MVAPKEVPGLRALLGLFSYYRKFVPHFTAVAAPLNALLKKDYVCQWEAAEESAMQHLKDALYSDPVLRRPDYAQPFRLMTDWSQVGVGAVLSQQDSKGQEFVVAHTSRSCNAA